MSEEEKQVWTDDYKRSLGLYDARVHAYWTGEMGAKDWGDEEAGVYAEKNKKEIETANLKEMLYQRALEHEMSLEAAKAAEKFTAAPTKPDETTYRRILGLPIELQRMTYSHLPFYDAFTLRQTNRYFRNIIPPVRDIPAQDRKSVV